MAVKRSLKITSAIGAIDRRIKSLESTSNLSLPAGIVSPELDTTGEPSNNNRGEVPPDTFKKIIGARVYGPAATGNLGTRVELYFEEQPNALEIITETADEENPTELLEQRIQVYGVNGYSNVVVDLSSGKTFLPIEVARDVPDWADYGLREAANQTTWRQTPPVSPVIKDVVANTRVGVNSTIWYNPATQNPDTTDKDGKDVPVTRAVDSATVTGANVVVTLNAASHLFRVGDVISVDIPAPFIGLDYYNNNDPDGLFEITAVGSNTISYMLDAPVTSPTTYTYNGTTRHYVYGVARGFRPDGDIWIDEKTDPDTVWVWKKLRWYNTADPIGDVAAEKDGIAPSPVTSLAGTSTLPAGTTTPVIDLTWTPPTTRSNGASLSGFLDGYDIWYKRTTEAVWKTQFVKDGAGAVSSAQINDAIILQNFNYNIRVYAVDIMGQYSTAATVNVLTAKYSETLNPPSKPTVSSRLGTITVSWDGNDSTGNLPVRGVLYVEVHRSTTSGFTPSSSTLISTIQNNLGGDYVVVSNLAYGTNYYFKLVFVRQVSPTELEDSSPSTQSDAIQVSPLVDTDVIANTISGAKITPGTLIASEKIVANSITGAQIDALAITAGKIAANAINADKIEAGAITASIIDSKQIELKVNSSATKRIVLNSSGITAYNGVDVTPTFSFDGQTGTLNAAALVVQNINADNIETGTLSGITIQTSDNTKRVILEADTAKFFFDSGLRGSIDATYDASRLLFGLNVTSTSGMFLTAPSGVFITDAAGITGNIGAFSTGQFGDITTDSVKRSSGNGNLLFQTTAGTVVANVFTGTSTTTGTNLWVIGRGSAELWVDRSSRRYKTNIEDFSDSSDKVLNLRVVTYQSDPKGRVDDDGNLIPLGDTTVGLIAEEVAEAGLGSIVAFDPDNSEIVEGLDYGRVGVLLIPIVKRLKEELEDLKLRLDNQ
jgi:hypothetical protein